MAVLPASEPEFPLVFSDVVEPSVLVMLELSRKELYTSFISSCIEKAQVVIDYSWEKLNTGTWREVDKEWRRVYSYGCLFKAVGTCRGETSQDKVQDAIKTCDMGLLMGASVMDNVLQRLIEVLKNKVIPDKVVDKEQPGPKVILYMMCRCMNSIC